MACVERHILNVIVKISKGYEMRKFIFVGFLLLAFQAQASTISGIKIDDSVVMDGHSLVLNGVGIRAKFVVDVYVVALYLSKKVDTEEAYFADKGPQRISLTMMRNVGSQLFSDGLNASILANNTEAEMKTLDKKVDTMLKLISAIPELKKGGVIYLDYTPDLGTKVIINNELKGTIEGEDFHRALLKIWLGKKPVNRHLKRVLLGEEDGR